MTQSSLERTFLYYWTILGDGSEPVAEYHFDNRTKPRKWRSDFAFVPEQVLIECEGLSWSNNGKSRHTTMKGYSEDCWKYNRAGIQGWLVLHYTQKMLEDDPQAVINEVMEALQIRRKETA